MIITAKTKSYECNKSGMHYHREEGNCGHRIRGSALIGRNYNRAWYHKDHYAPFQETGPGHLYLSGASDYCNVEGEPCSEEEYGNHCKNQNL